MKLNKRQQKYLIAIYQFEQEAEKEQEQRFYKGLGKLPADEWRWITYGSKDFPTPLFELINEIERDSGTGMTFKALQRRDLILVQQKKVVISRNNALFEVFVPEFRITSSGRAKARDLLGEKPKKKLKAGTLRESQWKALSEAYQKRGEFTVTTFSISNYNVWKKLSEFYDPNLGLVEFENSTLCINELGRWYYAHYYDFYSEVYPNVDSVKPAIKDFKIIPPKAILALVLVRKGTKTDLDFVCHALCQQGFYPSKGNVKKAFSELNLDCPPRILYKWVDDWCEKQAKIGDYNLGELCQWETKQIDAVEIAHILKAPSGAAI